MGVSVVRIRSSGVKGVSDDHLKTDQSRTQLSVSYLLSPNTRISLEAGMPTPINSVLVCLEYISTI